MGRAQLVGSFVPHGVRQGSLNCIMLVVGLDYVVINFVCQLGWTVVPRYLVKHYSDVSTKVFWMRLTFKSVDFE